VLADPDWTLPPLERVVEVPVFGSDGHARVEPGYDRSSRLLHVPSPRLDIPAVPKNQSLAEIREAADLLIDLVHDFPFVADSDRALALGAAILPFVRWCRRAG